MDKIIKEDLLSDVLKDLAPKMAGFTRKRSGQIVNVAKIGRNKPCPCGAVYPNGMFKKWKDCCGKYNT